MSTKSTMINDRYCLNCGLTEHDCNSDMKEDINGYCVLWTPTAPDLNDAPDCIDEHIEVETNNGERHKVKN